MRRATCVGRGAGNAVPAIVGLPSGTSEDRLKALGAAAASLRRRRDVPRGRDHAGGADARGRRSAGEPRETRSSSPASDLRAARDELTTVAAGPHRRRERRHAAPLAASCDGSTTLVRRQPPVVPFYANTGRDVAAVGSIGTRSRDAGVTVVTDTCTYITPILHDIDGPVMTELRRSGPGTRRRTSASTSRSARSRNASGRLAGPACGATRTFGATRWLRPDARRRPRRPASALVLDEPLSFWGGLDPRTGELIDTHHPQRGAIAHRSRAGDAVRPRFELQLVRARRGDPHRHRPAASSCGEPDGIVALGAIVARELYGRSIPVVVLEPHAYDAIADEEVLAVTADDGRVTVGSGP